MVRSDPVFAFVRDARGSAVRSDERLRRLSLRSSAPSARPLTDTPASNEAQTDIVDALRARDEQLLAAAHELRTHIETLTRATALLERERSKYLDLFIRAPDAYIVTDLKGTAEEANVAAGALFGVEPVFFAGRLLIAFVARQDTRAYRAFLTLLAGAASGGGLRAISLRMRPRGGQVMLVQARASVVRGTSDHPIAIRWTLRGPDATTVV